MSDIDTSADGMLRVNALHFPNRANEALAFAAAEIKKITAERDALREQVAEVRNAALEEAAKWHQDRALYWQRIIDQDGTAVSGDKYGARAAGHSLDAESIRALKNDPQKGDSDG